MFTVRLFSQGLDLYALKFYLHRVVSINHSWYRKTKDTGLSGDEDRIPLSALVLTIPECDGQTDGRTNGFAIAYRSLAKLCFGVL